MSGAPLYLADKKTPPPRTFQDACGPMVVLGDGAFCYEQGAPVTLGCRQKVDGCITKEPRNRVIGLISFGSGNKRPYRLPRSEVSPLGIQPHVG